MDGVESEGLEQWINGDTGLHENDGEIDQGDQSEEDIEERRYGGIKERSGNQTIEEEIQLSECVYRYNKSKLHTMLQRKGSYMV